MPDLPYTLPSRRLRRRGDIAGLVRQLRSPNPYDRAAALDELGKTRATGTVDEITPMVRVEHERVRLAAARALAAIGGPQARLALESLLTDSDPRLRSLAVRGLGRLGDPRSTEALRAFARDRFPEDGQPETRALAVRILGRLGNAPAAEGIVEALADPRAEVRKAARRALRGIKGVEICTDSANLRGSRYEQLLGKWALRSLSAAQTRGAQGD
jgi:HEAT repeat protein